MNIRMVEKTAGNFDTPGVEAVQLIKRLGESDRALLYLQALSACVLEQYKAGLIDRHMLDALSRKLDVYARCLHSPAHSRTHSLTH